jgi:hypothetical protein
MKARRKCVFEVAIPAHQVECLSDVCTAGGLSKDPDPRVQSPTVALYRHRQIIKPEAPGCTRFLDHPAATNPFPVNVLAKFVDYVATLPM